MRSGQRERNLILKMNPSLKAPFFTLAAIVLLGCLSGCLTPPSQLCPAPNEFDRSCKNGWLSSEARPIAQNGQVKSIVIDEYWYSHKYAQYTIDLPKGARDVGFRQEKSFFFLSYFLTDPNKRILEQWEMEDDSIGGGLLDRKSVV